MTDRTRAVIIGSGNIGTDLLIKVKRLSPTLEVAAMVGIDPDSDGLARARRFGVDTTSQGVEGLLRMDVLGDVGVVFDATSAGAHVQNDAALRDHELVMVDLTPAAIGPFVVPAVNLEVATGERNVNMVTCGGQATVPVVAALSGVAAVPYAEIVASIASRSAGPGTRANIDEFTETTASALEVVGGAERGKAIIVLNPAEPPMIMRDTVVALVAGISAEQAQAAVESMVETVAAYVPGYRLKQRVQVQDVPLGDRRRRLVAEGHRDARLQHVSVFLEVEGAAHYLPSYAGNLDIMTSAALRVGEAAASGVAERSAATAGVSA